MADSFFGFDTKLPVSSRETEDGSTNVQKMTKNAKNKFLKILTKFLSFYSKNLVEDAN